MESIVFSSDPKLVKISEAIDHLKTHDLLYFAVRFHIVLKPPLSGFIHIKGEQVRYACYIDDIIPFMCNYYENRTIAGKVIPATWINDWAQNANNIRNGKYKYTLVISNILNFNYDTLKLEKYNGNPVGQCPQGYTRILSPKTWLGF